MVFLIQQTMLYAIPLMIVALAGIFAERSGVINLALEGIMIIGAFVGALFVRIMQENQVFTQEQGQLLMLLALVVSAIFGAIFSLLLAFSAINLKADQTIGGTALNMLAPAIVLFLINLIAQQNALGMATGDAAGWFMIKPSTFGLERDHDFGFIGNLLINKVYLTTYICLAIFIVLSIILYKTKFGIRLRSCGENPQAADSLGINVYKMRYAGVTISGALAGMIFGNWTPLNVALGGILFGLFKCIAATYSSLDINGDGVYMLAELGISPYVYRLLPYLITLIVLAFTSKKSRVPKAEGIPYDKGQR